MRWVRGAAVFICAVFTGMGEAFAEPREFRLDPEHLTVAFLVDHIGFARTLGVFREATGRVVFDEKKPALESIDISVKAGSVDTAHKARDRHIRGGDFLDADDHPVMRFVLTGSQKKGGRTGTITGDLTMRGQTRPVTLDVTWNRSGNYPFGDRHYTVGVSARGTIRRSRWGMTYAVANGLVGDEVEIIVEAELIRED